MHSDGARYIKVINSGDAAGRFVSFEMCNYETATCEQVGRQKYYQVASLQQKKRGDQLKGTSKLLGETVVAAGGAYIGLWVGAISAASLGYSALMGVDVGSAVGGLTVATIESKFARAKQIANPMENFRLAQKLNDDVILDKPVYTENIDAFKDLLEKALDE